MYSSFLFSIEYLARKEDALQLFNYVLLICSDQAQSICSNSD